MSDNPIAVVPSRLETRALQIGYTEPLIPTLDLLVHSGSILGILGASGRGKSTLLKTLAGVTPPLSGRVLIDGRDVTGTAIHERGIGFVFQEPLLFTHLNVIDNIAYGLRRHRVPKTQARERGAELLDWVGLAGKERTSVHELSGGQAQRVALARALAPEPAVMLLDEPFSALDTELRSRLVAEVSAMLRQRGCATVYVTHDPSEAAAIADSVIQLESTTATS
ncbi:MAG: ABC transporter ATP-binding protein [Actinobacteria bacterium]|nr:ABC transporter ATP-binding protein [Actinomycetota bacterium]